MEIVTEPDFRSKSDVLAYLEELQKLMRWCGASDADMEKGQLRCDVNISIRPVGSTELRNRVELKNINSFSSIGRAIDVEFARQVDIYDSGETLTQETRGWDDAIGESHSMRSKEDAMDYRYFPEPDLPPLVITPEYIRERAISDLPMDRRHAYEASGLSLDDARILSGDRAISDYYESLVALTGDMRRSCSYITTILFSLALEAGEMLDVSKLRFTLEEFAVLIKLVGSDELSSTGAKQVFAELYTQGGSTETIVDRLRLRQVNDTAALEAIVDQVLADSPTQIADYQGGKVGLFGYFVGQCMKISAGKGNPKVFTEILKGRVG